MANALVNKGGQGLGINLRQRQAEGQFQGRGGFHPQLFQQQAGGNGAVVRLLFNAAPGGHDQGRQYLFFGDAVVKVPQRSFYKRFTVNTVKALAGVLHLNLHQPQVQRCHFAIRFLYGKRRVGFHRGVQSPLPGVFFPVKHVGTGNLLFFRPHQGQFYLILNVLDVDLAAGLQATVDGLNNLPGSPRHGVMNAGGTGGRVTFHRKKSLGDGNADFGRIKTDQRSVTLDDLKGFGVSLVQCGRLGFSQTRGGHGCLLNTR